MVCFIIQKDFLRALIFFGKLEARLSSAIHGGVTEGSIVKFIAGPHKCEWKIIWEKEYPCASVMLGELGYQRFIPDAKSFDEALGSYFKLYGHGHNDMWEWDAHVRASRLKFIAWEGQVLSYVFDGVRCFLIKLTYLMIHHNVNTRRWHLECRCRRPGLKSSRPHQVLRPCRRTFVPHPRPLRRLHVF